MRGVASMVRWVPRWTVIGHDRHTVVLGHGSAEAAITDFVRELGSSDQYEVRLLATGTKVGASYRG